MINLETMAAKDQAETANDLIMKKAYCEAITKLMPAIVPVLKSEIAVVVSEAYSKGLIGKSVYSEAITPQSDPRQKTETFLMTVKSQINTRINFYDIFLEIIRNTEAIGHIAWMLEQKVKELLASSSRRK